MGQRARVLTPSVPLGPWLVTADEIKNPQRLNVWLDVNGERKQEESTKDMIFSCAEIISYLSNMITLHPGDVIYSGTPSGVGLGIKPKPQFLKPGDVITMGIDGPGRAQEQGCQLERQIQISRTYRPKHRKGRTIVRPFFVSTSSQTLRQSRHHFVVEDAERVPRAGDIDQQDILDAALAHLQ